jgi:DedD protein
MDQGLKERLIGAAVLVALGVWLIPWVLDGKKEQVDLDSADAALRLPTPEEPLPVRSQTLSLDEPEPFVEPEQPATATARGSAPEPDEPIPAPPPAEEPVVARADPAPAPNVQRPAEAAPQKPEPAPPAAPVPAAARTDTKGDWVVQLGSFGEEANAKRLAQRVSTFGYKPDVSNHRANGRVMYRVRVGPYATRPQADASASALSAHGLPAQVVAAD